MATFGRAALARGRTSGIRAGHPSTTVRHLGRPRSRPRRADGASPGEAVPGCGRAVAGVSPGSHPVSGEPARLHRICVFAGSSGGRRPQYRTAAEELGRSLAARGIELVYGGARIGLMGTMADAVLASGGRATGVIPGA